MTIHIQLRLTPKLQLSNLQQPSAFGRLQAHQLLPMLSSATSWKTSTSSDSRRICEPSAALSAMVFRSPGLPPLGSGSPSEPACSAPSTRRTCSCSQHWLGGGDLRRCRRFLMQLSPLPWASAGHHGPGDLGPRPWPWPWTCLELSPSP